MGLIDRLFGPPSKDQFAKALIAEFRRAGEQRDLVYDRERFRIARGKDNYTNLGNIYDEHCRLPKEQRKRHVMQLARSFVAADNEPPADFASAKESLLPKVWSRSSFAFMELEHRVRGEENAEPLEQSIPLHPLGAHLQTSLVYDLPASMRSISNDELEGWNVTYERALKDACANLHANTSGYSQIGEGFYSMITGDSYDSARILLLDFVRSLEVSGSYVALLPNRDNLMITGSDDEAGLTIMAALGEKAVEEGRPLSAVPLRLDGSTWSDWLPPKGHAAFERFNKMACEFLGSLYADQKRLLDEIHEREETDIFVASFSGVVDESQAKVRTYCVWSDGVAALIPKTDFVAFTSDDGVVARGDWDSAMEICGELVQREERLYPERYRVLGFPSSEQLEKIGDVEFFDAPTPAVLH